ncbi:MAG: methylmalonate-semialdehyde dehydrogenase (CoA acylating) [Pelagibacteraceae bacterium]|nr:methylmalonate-semialdehyde dehydrogenase (CoA acylating) [Pelagibacteraceae bacterium]PPR51258.1 MAG: putative 3-oxopropanoate dehydrogenase [Alphaproteobacteria bacterium MarineAlpha5_Bin10]|tara:strand:+ start:1244 stop:2734 length:1491 start_codon:yes stop_codon:yes gene_type:complete
MKRINNYLNGKDFAGTSKSTLPVYNPATGEVISEVVLSNKDDFDKAVEVSNKSFQDWSRKTPLYRSRIISKYKDLLESNKEELAKLVSEEHGKTLEDAKGSVTRGIEVVEFASGIPHLLKGEFSQNVGTNIDSWSVRQPLGICAGITPFNFPAMVPMWMYPVSIACGNSFILKPSEKDPSCSIRLAELFSEAGLPDGVFNVLNGDKEVVNYILQSKDIASVSFVGSTPVAKYIYEESAKSGKRVQALGGAKNHLVVMPDANLDQTVDGIMGAAYGSAGERCMAVSVAVAVGNVADDLVERIHSKTQNLKVLPWTDNQADMGPLISKEHLKKVTDYIAKGVEEGAKLVADGRNYKLQGYENGYFIGPSLFDNVSKDMTIYKEEIFGPVLSVVRVNSYDEAVSLVNDHPFGNGASVYTQDGDVARDFTTNVKIGMVGVNVPIPVPMAFHSFGGWKNSLFGAHAMHGTEGVHFFTKLKTTTSRWPTSIRSGAEYKMPTN